MATKTTVQLIDDLDGNEASQSIEFGLDGVTYSIDVSDEHAQDLRDALDPWRAVARRVHVKRSSGTGMRTALPDARPGFSSRERHSMQNFARAHDLKIPADRGRIAHEIIESWEAAGRPT
jgi:hypothetical protein